MNISEPFIRRPVATTLISVGIALAGMAAFRQLPIAQVPQVDLPTIQVSATMPGASPETMASSVATPLERHLGQIADVTEMTSQSSVGSTNITLQFGLNRNIDGAASDVQAAINASRADLPTALHSNPTYRKANSADEPVAIMSLSSDTLSPGQLYDLAATIIQQRLSQVPGVGQVDVGGSSLPAVRVELNPPALFKYGVGLEDIRAALSAANANSPKGAIESDRRHWQITSNDQAHAAASYRPLIVAYRNGAPVRLAEVAAVEDSVEDVRNIGIADGHPAVVITVSRQPAANIVDLIDRIHALLPELQASLPAAAKLTVAIDRSIAIRASLHEVEISLVLSVILVILVVFFFLRDWRATLIPCAAVPISLIGTFGIMYLLGYSLDNFSLMALTVATGFVVDDAIVVMENIVRHTEAGMPRLQAALLGVRQVGFTVISMSLSLVAVFIPILLMGGVVGRLFREFTLTLSASIAVSLLVSLTLTPMMCSRVLRPAGAAAAHGWIHRAIGRFLDRLQSAYAHALGWVLNRQPLMLAVLAATIGLNVWLFGIIPKGFFPDQDTGRIVGFIQADQSVSFGRLAAKLKQFTAIVAQEPDVEALVGVAGAGGRGANTGRVYIGLKPLAERKSSSFQIMDRLRPQLSRIAGATLYLSPGHDVQIGGRQSNATYQYTLEADNLHELQVWTPRLLEALGTEPLFTDLNSDQQDKGLETDLVIDRDSAYRLGLTASEIDNTLYDAFGQRQVSTIYESLNQYHVVMVVAPRYYADPASLNDLYVSTSGGGVTGTQSTNAVAGTVTTGRAVSSSVAVAADSARNASLNAIGATGKGAASSGQAVSTSRERMIPLSAFAHYQTGTTPLSVNHQGQAVAATLSFNLSGNGSLSDAVEAVNRQIAAIHMPSSIHGSFQGTAKTYQDSVGNELVLILAAVIAIYVVLGILYESYAHPVTIISTLPSAGLGAVLALLAFGTEFSLIALIGVILLIGIVKKNAIMMIDFAVEAERTEGLSPREAIRQACLMRFRPIMMTTMAAILGALPLAIGLGAGGELRRPLGISIVGGLIVSQVLTLLTTPVVYLYVDRMRNLGGRWAARRVAAPIVPLPARPAH
jgi:multidrug efflux pump